MSTMSSVTGLLEKKLVTKIALFKRFFCQKIGVFDSKQRCIFYKNLIIRLAFGKNANFSQKIVENRRKLLSQHQPLVTPSQGKDFQPNLSKKLKLFPNVCSASRPQVCRDSTLLLTFDGTASSDEKLAGKGRT
jgi:hypothetical protein